MKLSRRTYADHFGPTTGDRVRLAWRPEQTFAVAPSGSVPADEREEDEG